MLAKELALKLNSPVPPCVLDVRSSFEFKAGHIPTAVHAPFWSILLRLSSLPKDKESLIVLTCEHGPRAQLAKSMLGAVGFRNLQLLKGHMSGWRRDGLPLEK